MSLFCRTDALSICVAFLPRTNLRVNNHGVLHATRGSTKMAADGSHFSVLPVWQCTDYVQSSPWFSICFSCVIFELPGFFFKLTSFQYKTCSNYAEGHCTNQQHLCSLVFNQAGDHSLSALTFTGPCREGHDPEHDIWLVEFPTMKSKFLKFPAIQGRKVLLEKEVPGGCLQPTTTETYSNHTNINGSQVSSNLQSDLWPIVVLIALWWRKNFVRSFTGSRTNPDYPWGVH